MVFDAKRERSVSNRRVSLQGSGAAEIDRFGINPFVGYNTWAGLSIDCDSVSLRDYVQRPELKAVPNYQPPPASLPQIEIEKLKPWFEAISQSVAVELLDALDMTKPGVSL